MTFNSVGLESNLALWAFIFPSSCKVLQFYVGPSFKPFFLCKNVVIDQRIKYPVNIWIGSYKVKYVSHSLISIRQRKKKQSGQQLNHQKAWGCGSSYRLKPLKELEEAMRGPDFERQILREVNRLGH